MITEPTEAVLRVVLACTCGSDLRYCRRESPNAIGSIGHEFSGFVEHVASAVQSIVEGDLVIAPFLFSDGTWALSDGRGP